MQTLPCMLHQRTEQIPNNPATPRFNLRGHDHAWCQANFPLFDLHGALRERPLGGKHPSLRVGSAAVGLTNVSNPTAAITICNERWLSPAHYAAWAT